MPSSYPTPIGRWLQVFDESQRRKLREAGVFPSDEQLEMMRQQEARHAEIDWKMETYRNAKPQYLPWPTSRETPP